LESTGSHGRGVERRVPEMRRMVVSTAHRPDLCEQSVTKLGRSTLLLNSKAPEQMIAVLALVPQVEPASFTNKLFRFFSLPAVLSSILCTLHTLRQTDTA